jgi:regulator of sigma E protease
VNASWTSLLWQIPVGLAVLSFLVFIHELGHFLVARREGVRIHAFAIGFGPRLVGLQVGETEYKICAIPFGGYVAMAGESPDDVEGAKDPRAFDNVSIGARARIAAAGPLVNILFAFVAIWVAGMAGVREPVRDVLVVAGTAPGGPAARAGVRSGDTLVSVDGQKMTREMAFVEKVALSKGRTVQVKVRRGGRDLTLPMVPEATPDPKIDLGWAGLWFGGRVMILEIVPGGAAQAAGLRADDTILSLAGIPLTTAEDLPDQVNASGGDPMRVVVARPGQRVELDLRARFNETEKRWMIGVRPGSVVPLQVRSYGPVASAGRAVGECWKHGTAIFRFLGALLSGRLAAKNLAGPVGIVQMSGVAASTGWQTLVDFMAMVSINLGILNFMPLVVTDGGRLVELAIEKIRGRRANRRFMEILTNVVMYAFLSLALYVTFHDLMRVPMFLR